MVLDAQTTRLLKGKDRPQDGEEYRVAVIERFLKEEHILGKVVITDKLNFNDYEGIVDIFIRGAGQMIRWAGESVTAPRTPGISTTELIKKMEGKA
jgi:bifunctional ADP-heptose synthase (sugar kinase/adenylyltransferase)